jgi:hypothetical protein
MARSSSGKGNGNSRIRFIMLDADLNDTDLTQITQAITNALKPQTVVHHRMIAASPAMARMESGEEQGEMVDELLESPGENGAEEPSASTGTGGRTRKYRSPKVLDVDLASEPSFASYAQEKNPQTDQKRFLTVGAWFKQHRGQAGITMDHVYTCYRAVKWPTDIGDFDAPLRSLKGRQLMNKVGRGEYAINHLGLAEVDRLGAE